MIGMCSLSSSMHLAQGLVTGLLYRLENSWLKNSQHFEE